MIETSYRQLVRKKKTHHITTKHEHMPQRKQQKTLGFQTPPKNAFGPQQHSYLKHQPQERFGSLGKVSVNPAAVEKETTPRKVNMEPKNHPFRKENHLPNHHFQVPC